MTMRLVQTGEHAVKDVAKQCGFTSPNYFCTVFRQTFGVTPGSVAASRLLPVAPLTPRSLGHPNRVCGPTRQRNRPN
jgi:AraC-like DNA-binding protein